MVVELINAVRAARTFIVAFKLILRRKKMNKEKLGSLGAEEDF